MPGRRCRLLALKPLPAPRSRPRFFQRFRHCMVGQCGLRRSPNFNVSLHAFLIRSSLTSGLLLGQSRRQFPKGSPPSSWRPESCLASCSLRVGLSCNARIRLWSDCLGVVLKLDGLFQGGKPSPSPSCVPMLTCGARLLICLSNLEVVLRVFTRFQPTMTMRPRSAKFPAGCFTITS